MEVVDEIADSTSYSLHCLSKAVLLLDPNSTCQKRSEYGCERKDVEQAPLLSWALRQVVCRLEFVQVEAQASDAPNVSSSKLEETARRVVAGHECADSGVESQNPRLAVRVGSPRRSLSRIEILRVGLLRRGWNRYNQEILAERGSLESTIMIDLRRLLKASDGADFEPRI